jgi:prepilin peptidase CpaA
MSGRTDAILYGVSIISVIAATTDLIWGRIFNWLTATALVIGAALAGWAGGWAGLGDSLAGALAGLLAYGWMFKLGFMGGGDVKFLMALGAWGGLRYVEEVAVLGVLVGGAMAVPMLMAKGRLLSLVRRLFSFLRSVAVPQLEVEPLQIDRKLTMPFGVPIAVAAVWTALDHPLVKWGMPTWP